MNTALSPLAHALRQARQQANLTQDELGRKLGLKGRAIYRWERDDAKPSRLNQRRVVQAIGSVHEGAGATLSAAFAAQGKRSRTEASPPPAPTPAPAPPVLPRAVLEHGVFTMADELDLPARRVRGSLSRWLRRVREANLSFEVAQRELDGWIGESL